MGGFFSRPRRNQQSQQQQAPAQPQNPPAATDNNTSQPPAAGGGATEEQKSPPSQPASGGNAPATEPATSQPEPEQKQPDPAPAQPAPAQPEPEQKQDPQPAPEQKQEPDPAPAQPEPAQPEPEQKQPDPAPAQPDPQPAQPEPQPEPQPDPQPEPAPVDPPQPEPQPEPEQPVVDPQPDPAPEPAVDVPEEKVPPGPQVVTRKEIRSMPRAEQDRFFDAVFKMMENKDGPGTSEYFRVAGYHGNPGNHYCAHGVETFPGWHRIYLLEFQNALQAADRALGNDGNIGLAYWDWTVDTRGGIPDIVKEKLPEFPAGLFPDNNDWEWPRIQRRSDRSFYSRMQRSRVVQRASECLLATQHWAHASTAQSRNSRYPSLETPHNSVHVCCGAPMSSVAWAAFDICFWLHHCNIDRIYSAYLELEPDSAQEFEMFQNSQRRDLFDENFQPFTKPDGSRYSAKDTFSTIDLGYQYAELPRVDAQAMQTAPTYAIFEQIRIAEMLGACYELHVFVVPTAEADDFQFPEDSEEYENSPAYAGFTVIFGKGPNCEACKVRPPYDLRVDISDCLRNQGLSRYDVTLKVMTLETTANDRLRPLEETPVPPPVIDGPLFDDRESPLDEGHKAEARPEDVRALQEYLQMFGYYGDEIDGDFGPVTDKAVRQYQKLAGLVIDGQVGPVTKKQILNATRCGERDVDEGATVANAAALEFARPRDQGPFYGGRKEISYSVGVVPGYLRRGDVLGALEGIFGQYSQAAELTFNLTDDEEKSDIKISWTLGQGEKKSVRFDGAGGVLARGGEGFLHLDEAERWTLNPDEAGNLEDRTTWRRGDPVVLFQHVALHELGHALGLAHSEEREDVMAPYYNPGMLELSETDKARVAAIYA